MAGERMKLDGYSKITAVCPHPSEPQSWLRSGASECRLPYDRGPRRDAVPAVFSENAPALRHRMGLRIRRRLYGRFWATYRDRQSACGAIAGVIGLRRAYEAILPM